MKLIRRLFLLMMDSKRGLSQIFCHWINHMRKMSILFNSWLYHKGYICAFAFDINDSLHPGVNGAKVVECAWPIEFKRPRGYGLNSPLSKKPLGFPLEFVVALARPPPKPLVTVWGSVSVVNPFYGIIYIDCDFCWLVPLL